jgi:hypothetical protein
MLDKYITSVSKQYEENVLRTGMCKKLFMLDIHTVRPPFKVSWVTNGFEQ